jgi:hypothetical protein
VYAESCDDVAGINRHRARGNARSRTSTRIRTRPRIAGSTAVRLVARARGVARRAGPPSARLAVPLLPHSVLPTALGFYGDEGPAELIAS